MHMTQQEFAVHVLKSALTTVARYEMGRVPSVDTLQQLARIADAKGFIGLRDRFADIWARGLSTRLPLADFERDALRRVAEEREGQDA
jgi:hypothetical protein